MTQRHGNRSRNSDCVCGDDALYPLRHAARNRQLTYAVGGTPAGWPPGQNRKAVKQRSDPTIAPNGPLHFHCAAAAGKLVRGHRCTCTGWQNLRGVAGSAQWAAADVTSAWSTAARRSLGNERHRLFDSALRDGEVLYIGGALRKVGRPHRSFARRRPRLAQLRQTRGRMARYITRSRMVREVVSRRLGLLASTGSTQKYLVRLRRDGSVDPTFAAAPSDTVNAIALSGNTLFVGGQLVQMNEANVPYLRRLMPRRVP